MGSSAPSETPGAAPSKAPEHSYESLRVTAAERHILHVELNRLEKRNAMNRAFWRSGLHILEACLQEEAGLGGGRQMDRRVGISTQTQPSPPCPPQGDGGML